MSSLRGPAEMASSNTTGKLLLLGFGNAGNTVIDTLVPCHAPSSGHQDLGNDRFGVYGDTLGGGGNGGGGGSGCWASDG